MACWVSPGCSQLQSLQHQQLSGRLVQVPRSIHLKNQSLISSQIWKKHNRSMITWASIWALLAICCYYLQRLPAFSQLVHQQGPHHIPWRRTLSLCLTSWSLPNPNKYIQCWDWYYKVHQIIKACCVQLGIISMYYIHRLLIFNWSKILIRESLSLLFSCHTHIHSMISPCRNCKYIQQ